MMKFIYLTLIIVVCMILCTMTVQKISSIVNFNMHENDLISELC